MYKEGKQYGEARSRCEEDGGHLYYYKNLATDEPVITELLQTTMTSSDEVWVGADRLTTSDYQWHDGSSLPNNDPIWYGPEPTLGGEYCVGLKTTAMLLNDLTCDNENYFICQIDV
ncbi:chondrolectin-like [Littorina saxatilis]|uniref:chondrolectin-like n=1 Tax=Littorina saxatilis TaxID=31220 RepID=UPI0038B631F3